MFPKLCLYQGSLTPSTVLGLLLSLVRDQFASPGNVSNDRLKKLQWVSTPTDRYVADAAKTTIEIEPLYAWRPEQAALRPAVVISRGQLTLDAVPVIGGAGMGSVTPSDFPEAGERIFRVRSGGYRIMCCAHDAGTAEALGYEVFGRLEVGSHILERQDGRIMRCRVTSYGELSKLKDHAEVWAVPLGMEVAYQSLYTISQEAPRLQKVAVTTDQ